MPVVNPYAVNIYVTNPGDASPNGLRLTLESGVPVSSTDQTAKTTLYLTPYTSGMIAIYDGTVWQLRATAEISLALGTLTSGKNYDVFAYYTGSAVALELVVWTNDTTRASSLGTQNGVYTKNADATRRYVGTIRTTSTTTTEDSAAKRFVWNGPEPWRQIGRVHVSPVEGTDSWTYATGSWRQARATATNQVETVVGLATVARAEVLASGNSTSNNDMAVGIGIDSTSTNSATLNTHAASIADREALAATYNGVLSSGYHYLAWLEIALDAATVTFFGDGAYTSKVRSGINAQVPG